MIFNNEFIWYKDHFVHHLTTKDKMVSIIEKGLIPLIGERSIKVGEAKKRIYFFDDLNLLDSWIEELYLDKNISELELLRFNIKRRKWNYRDSDFGDYYLERKIEAENIEYLRIYSNNKLLSLSEQNLLIGKSSWQKIINYK
ncbi:MAG: hypothetical protein PHQ64_04320 [Bacilli bacterium]|nr:hypothetical protein [Bacilli bacterium]